MSLSPTVPDFKAGLKTFWQKPEGKLGIVVLCACAAGAAVFIMPYALAFTIDLVHLAILGGGLFVAGAIVLNPTFRAIVSNVFQSTMRGLTNQVIQTNPIGILENTLDKMRKNSQRLAKAVGSCNGAKVGIKAQIDNNADKINHATSLKAQAEKQLASAKDPIAQQRFSLTRTMQLQEIGRRMHSNDKLKQIYDQTDKMYNLLVRWQQLGDFNIENTQAQIDNAKEERKAILAAYAGMGFAQKLIKGDPEQLKMLNASLEYLADDNANKLGEMEDFARYSEKYLTNMDLEQGASADDAEKMLAQFEQKLLSAGAQDSAPTSASAQPVPISKAVNDNYWK